MSVENCSDGFMICFDDDLSREQIHSFIKSAKKKLLHLPAKPAKHQRMSCSSSVLVKDEDNQINTGLDKKKPKENILECSLSDTTKYVALDCEFVGVGPRGRVSALGRCTIVDFNGRCMLDIYAKPEETITDYRTRWSGIRRRDMYKAVPFEFAQSTIRKMLQGKILVGHALQNDLKVLKIDHPKEYTRDTSKCFKLKSMAGLAKERHPPSLKRLSKLLLGLDIQKKSHCSLEDAVATMNLFRVSMNQLTPIIPETGELECDNMKKETKPKQNRNRNKKRRGNRDNLDMQPVYKKVKPLLDSLEPQRYKENTLYKTDSQKYSSDTKYMCDSPWYYKPKNVSGHHSISSEEANHSYFSDHYWPEDIDFTADVTF